VCDLENLKKEEAMTRVGSWPKKKKTQDEHVKLNAAKAEFNKKALCTRKLDY
jgi:hypothetical protein